jgi:ABC-type glycerol-3-phosphate transport system substrate-binding protein
MAWTYFVAAILGVGKTLFRDGKAEFAGAEGITALEYLLDLYRAIRPPGANPAPGNDLAKFAAGTQPHTWSNSTAVRMAAQASPQEIEQIVVADPPMPGGGRFLLPAAVRARPISPNFSDWICIGSPGTAVDQAWELMKFLVEPANLLAYCETRYFQPPRKSVAGQGFMKEPHLQRMVAVFDRFGHAQIRVPDQAIFIKVMQDMGESVYTGQASPKQAVEGAAQLLQAELNKIGYKGTTL